MTALLAKKRGKSVSHDYVKHWLGEMEWKLEMKWELEMEFKAEYFSIRLKAFVE